MIRLLADVVRRRAAGEVLTDAQVMAQHPELMPGLVEELEGLRILQRAIAAGRRAGPIDEPLPPVSLDEYDAPILPADGADDMVGAPRASVPGYSVLREIGSGGQATVYKALHEATGRTMAVKILPGGALAASRDRRRFDREAEILASLDHPNIVTIIDRGRTADGSFYFVMPYVAGRPLDQFAADCLRDGGPGVLRLLGSFAKLARAVGRAHRCGIVHRDLKPSNVLVDAADEPHLLDFGLARPSRGGAEAWRVHSITAAGHVVGSLPWASPEQVCERTGTADADPRSDVYSLGVCLYQCLAGEHPYPIDGAIADLIERIRFHIPRPVRRLPQVSHADVRRVLDRCLAKSPGHRYPSADSLADDLDRVLSGRRLSPAKVRHGSRRSRRAASAGLAVLAVFALAAAVAWRDGRVEVRGGVTVFPLPTARNTVGMDLVRIPAGAFQMGTPRHGRGPRGDDERLHEVQISRSFWISTREVTAAEYLALMPTRPGNGGRDSAAPLPITGVTWEEATEFCRRLGEREGVTYRLPTEAEWEYACRAGVRSSPWAGTGRAADMGWTRDTSGDRLHSPAERSPNHWGLYDMHGNAAEWCADWYNEVYPTTRTDPVFRDRTGRRVIRGGSYQLPDDASRSAARGGERPTVRRADLGFRVVRAEPPASAPAHD